jgi:integrase
VFKSFANLNDLLEYLGVSRRTFYRGKKDGSIQVDTQLKDGLKSYIHYEAGDPRHFDKDIFKTPHGKHFNQWIEWRENGLHCKPWSKTYKRNQVLYLQLFLKEFGLITSGNLESCLQAIPTIQQSKRKDIHAAVSSFAKFLDHKGLLQTGEYQRIRGLYPKHNPYYQPQQRLIRKEQLETLINTAMAGHVFYQALLNKTLLVFLSETALRVSEASNLAVSDVQFSNIPSKAYINTFGKGGKRRLVPFSRPAQECLRQYLRHRPTNTSTEALFLAFNPKYGYTPLTSDGVIRRFKVLSESTGISFSAHSLRHYRITEWANNPRIPITTVQKWAGHTTLTVTQRYIHLTDEDALQAAFE